MSNDAASPQQASVTRLLAIMARLRDPITGCEWDRAQDFTSIAPYTIEEAYEVADAIARGDMEELREELGDLLLQVVFHARIAEEAGHFDFVGVADAISAKLEARHPHIFDQQVDYHADQSERWEVLKAQERHSRGATSAMDGVALALPALLRAEKLQRRASRQGFDWADTAGTAAKLVEEMDELDRACSPEERADEAGDLLFAAVNLVRKHGIAPEDALRGANAKFERRYRAMEQMAHQRGLDFGTLSPDQQEELWSSVKAAEQS